MKSPLDKLFGYQARLQGVVNSLGEELKRSNLILNRLTLKFKQSKAK